MAVRSTSHLQSTCIWVTLACAMFHHVLQMCECSIHHVQASCLHDMRNAHAPADS